MCLGGTACCVLRALVWRWSAHLWSIWSSLWLHGQVKTARTKQAMWPHAMVKPRRKERSKWARAIFTHTPRNSNSNIDSEKPRKPQSFFFGDAQPCEACPGHSSFPAFTFQIYRFFCGTAVGPEGIWNPWDFLSGFPFNHWDLHRQIGPDRFWQFFHRSILKFISDSSRPSLLDWPNS